MISNDAPLYRFERTKKELEKKRRGNREDRGVRKMEEMRKARVADGERVKSFILTVLSVIFLLFAVDNVTGGTVIPNGTFITGVTLEYGIVSSCLLGIQPDQTLYKLTIHLESSEDIVGMPNLLMGKEGEDITFYTKERLSPDIFGKKVRAEVTYRGDERGGRWWVRSVKILE